MPRGNIYENEFNIFEKSSGNASKRTIRPMFNSLISRRAAGGDFLREG